MRNRTRKANRRMGDAEQQMLCVDDFERYASKHLPHPTWVFFSMGAEKEITKEENKEAFKRYWFVPRMLQNVQRRNLSVEVLGERIDIPICLAPTAFQRSAHPDGEIGAAKAAAHHGTVYCMSTFSNTTLEDLSQNVPKCMRWMQIYIMKNRDVTARMVRRVEQNGFKALVLTVDTPVPGLHLRVKKCNYHPAPHLNVPNLFEMLPPANEKESKGYQLETLRQCVCDTLTWEDVKWLRSTSKLPIVLKGIMTGEDAKLAAENGASAVWVSNHGGRQLDGVEATIDVLEEIVKALEGTNCEVYVDSGFRWGSDILKALALGARAVFIGRPLLWGLAHSGENGVRRILEILKDELNLALSLSGCRDISEAGPHLLRKKRISKM